MNSYGTETEAKIEMKDGNCMSVLVRNINPQTIIEMIKEGVKFYLEVHRNENYFDVFVEDIRVIDGIPV